jgi:RND family efflux transporter MFP subunit
VTLRPNTLRFAATALALTALAMPLASAQQRPADPPVVGVMIAKRVQMAPTMTVPGTVVSRNDSQLASEVEGRVSWVAEVGTVVKANDVVTKVDPSLASLQMASDKANVARLAAQVAFDRNQADRMDNLFKQNAIAKSTRDQAAATRDMDIAALAQAQATMKKSQYQLVHGEIRAPFAGRVVARLINPGEYVTAGKPVLRLVDVAQLEVSVQAPIDASRYAREGMTLTLEIQGRPVVAQVRAIVPVGDIVSRTIELRLVLPPNAGLVGDAAKVFLPSAAPRQVLAVSRDALVLREDNTYIFKIDAKGNAQRIAVETGAEQGALVEVRGAIAPGDRVIVRGAERLEAGQKVKPVQV